MARNTRVWTATYGRDKDKRFVITEMPADQAERFGARLLLALANAGAKLPEGTLDAGMAGVAVSLPGLILTGLRALQGLEYVTVAPLLDEMMTCVRFIPPGQESDKTTELMGGALSQIDEVRTRVELRREIFELHVGFSLAAALSNSGNSPDSAESPAA